MTYTRFQVPIFHNTQNTLYSEDNKLKQISFVDSCVDMFLFCGDKSLEIGMKIDSIKALLDIPWTNDIENITAFDFSEKIVFDFDTGETNACLFNGETLVQSKNIYEIIDEDLEDMLCKIISKNNHVKEKLKNAFTENYNIFVPFPLNELNLKYFALMTQYQGYNKEFYYSIPFDDRKTITHFTFNEISKELKNGNNAMSLLEKYNVPHKKSIKRIFAERQGLFFYLKECGIMYNVINNIDLFSSFLNDKFCYYILSYLHTYPALENYFKDFVKYTNIVSFCNKMKKNLSFLSYAFNYNSLRSDMKQEKIKYIKKQRDKYESYPCASIPFSMPLINTVNADVKSIDGYDFVPLKNTSDCHIAGKQLSNSLKNWEYFYEPVVIVCNYKKTIAAIEFSDNHLRSAYKAYHCPVNTDIPLCNALKKWCVESGIDYQGYFEYIQGYEDK